MRRVEQYGRVLSPQAWIIIAALALAVLAAGWRGTFRTEGSTAFWLPPVSGLPAAPVGAPAAVVPTPALPAGPVSGRVGLQVGHWRAPELPDELAALRVQGGATASGHEEVQVNLAVAQKVAALLSARGVTVDLLPATIPAGYRADAFVALHCDVNNDAAMRGYKLARFSESAKPTLDDALLNTLGSRYAMATGLPRDSHITRAMTGYYAFNSAGFSHAIDPRTPAVIVELGFLTNPTDLNLLLSQPDLVAAGIADGILRFLTRS